MTVTCGFQLCRTSSRLRNEQAMAGLLPPESTAVVREVASATREGKDRPLTETIGPALDRWWESRARKQAKAGFRFHAQPSSRR